MNKYEEFQKKLNETDNLEELLETEAFSKDANEKLKTLLTVETNTVRDLNDRLKVLDKNVSDVLTSNKSFFNEEKAAAELKASQKEEREQIAIKDKEAQESLSKIIEEITDGIFGSVSIEFTQAPKHEVSYGLLVATEGATDLNIKERSHETVLGESVMTGKSKVNILSKLDPDKEWRVKDISELKNFIKYLQVYSKVAVKLTKKFESDLEGKINAELRNAQTRAANLKQEQESIEGNTSLAEIQKTTSIIEPIFIQGLKEIIHEITHGKIKLK